MRKSFYDCKTEEEKQRLRDEMLEVTYYQVQHQTAHLKNIKEQIKELKQCIEYLQFDEIEKKYVNKDGSRNYDAIVSLCCKIEKELCNGSRQA